MWRFEASCFPQHFEEFRSVFLRFFNCTNDSGVPPMKCMLPVLLALALTGVAAQNSAQVENPSPTVGPGSKGEAVLRAQVLLDRRSFSPGEIDGASGPNFRAALRGFQAAYQLPVSDVLTAEAWAVLNRDTSPVMTTYEISEEDVAGPFETIP